jgi:hypothetical protein
VAAPGFRLWGEIEPISKPTADFSFRPPEDLSGEIIIPLWKRRTLKPYFPTFGKLSTYICSRRKVLKWVIEPVIPGRKFASKINEKMWRQGFLALFR